MPASDGIVTLVRVFEYPSSVGIHLSPLTLGQGHGYDVMAEEGAVILRPTLDVSPFEGATAQRRLRLYSRVEVHYDASGVIPPALTEGAAFLAAGYFTDGIRALTGLTSERIGDYSYTIGSGGAGASEDRTPSYVRQALMFLDDFLRSSHVAVT
jgi:hypothetical protein